MPAPEPKRILLVSNVPPWPVVRNGGGQRTAIVWRALERLGYEVDLDIALPPGVEMPTDVAASMRLQQLPMPPITPTGTLTKLPGKLGRFFHSQESVRIRFRDRYRQLRQPALEFARYDAIVCRYLSAALVAGLDRIVDVPVYVDLDDVDWLTLRAKFAENPWPGFSGRRGMKRVMGDLEARCREVLPRFAGGFVACEEDLAEVKRFGLNAAVLPNIPVDTDALSAGELRLPTPLLAPATGKRVLFLGDLRHGPNTDGLTSFIVRGWPFVRECDSSATLDIVGRGLDEVPAEKLSIWKRSAGVNLVGFAEDLRQTYAEAALTIAPSWWGGGTKIKVVESAAMGRVCVVTDQSARGYSSLLSGDDAPLVFSDSAESMGRNVARLLEDPAELAARSAAGPTRVAEAFGPQRVVEIIGKALAGRDGLSLADS